MNAMNRDELIRDALTPAAHVQAPIDLGDEIYRTLIRTPQRRSGAWPFVAGRTPAMAGLWLLLIVSILIAGLVFAIGSLLPRPDVPGIIGMYHGGPERTGIMPGPGPAGTVDVGWSVTRRGGVPFNVMPVVSGDSVFVGDASGSVAALDAQGGGILWEADVASPVTASPVLVDDLVVVGTEDGAIVALDAATGNERWAFAAGSRVGASLAAVDGTVFAGTDDGTMYGLEATTGAPLWEHAADGAITRGPAIADGVMFLGAEGGQFSAIDIATLQVRWVAELGPGELATPAVTDGTVYTATGLSADVAHEVVALDIADGSLRWAFAAPSDQTVFVSAVADGLVYAGSEDSNLYAIDAASGALRWTLDTGGGVGSLAAFADGVLYVPSADRFVYAVDAATGEELWKVEVGGAPSIPVVIAGRVIVGTDLGTVVAIVGSDRR